MAPENFDDAEGKRIANAFYRVIKTAGLEDVLQDGNKLLDVGCGHGYFLKYIHNRFPNLDLYGVDISRYCVGESRRNAPAANIVQADFQALPFGDRMFDVVFSSNILDYIIGFDKPINVIKLSNEAYKVLKTGGIYFASDVNVQLEALPSELKILEKIFQRKNKQVFVKG